MLRDPDSDIEFHRQSRTRLFRNRGDGTFEDVTAESGIAADRVLAFTSQFIDVDGDRLDDLLLTGDFCTSRLYRNLGDMRFDDVSAQAGIGLDENGMGSVVGDLNGDGAWDWFVTSVGFEASLCPSLSVLTGCSGNRLYLGGPDGTFSEEGADAGVGIGGWGWGAAIEDSATTVGWAS